VYPPASRLVATLGPILDKEARSPYSAAVNDDRESGTFLHGHLLLVGGVSWCVVMSDVDMVAVTWQLVVVVVVVVVAVSFL
jgi:hypothetical protein